MTGFAENPALVILSAFFIFFVAAAGVMVILWIALPFSVFGTKGLLTRLIEEQEKTNALLKELLKAQRGKGPDSRGDYAEEEKKGGGLREEAEDEKTGINAEVKTIDL
ncbi:MAG: hypothetical protein HZB82_03105 [Deltaproteobacteria bacterium]|nr:hypothetical protein [Deltaproteobacteria bacterium]